MRQLSPAWASQMSSDLELDTDIDGSSNDRKIGSSAVATLLAEQLSRQA